MNKPDEIIRAFKLCIKEYKNKHQLVQFKYFQTITELLIREARGEPIGLLKYFEDYLPSKSPQYFDYLYHTSNPVRNIVYWKYSNH